MDDQNIVTAVEIGEEPEMVQLWEGGPYWATRNIGAEKPEDSGYYFWWGDTLGYKWENEQWVASDGSVSGFSFEASNTRTYNKDLDTLQSEGWTTSDGVLRLAHDAARAHWGERWRMPTHDEQTALVNNCDWNWTTKNGVNGYEVRGQGGFASRSIFLPCCGSGEGTSLKDSAFLDFSGSRGYYWSSLFDTGYSSSAWYLSFQLDSYDAYCCSYRILGFPIRPVQSPDE